MANIQELKTGDIVRIVSGEGIVNYPYNGDKLGRLGIVEIVNERKNKVLVHVDGDFEHTSWSPKFLEKVKPDDQKGETT